MKCRIAMLVFVLSLSAAPITAQAVEERLAELERRMAALEALLQGLVDRNVGLPEATSDTTPAAQYLALVEVRNVRVAKTVLADRGVFGELKNLGGRTLKTVEITIYFLDADGRPVHEESYRPVRPVTDFDFDNDGVLKPGYSRKFGYRADDAPSDWSGEVSVVVMSVEFDGETK